jgi:uncharacterized phage infection (PIP) family protein YhgE
MRSQRVAQQKFPEEVDEMNTQERLGKLEVKVDHLQSDITEVKTDLREVKADVRKLWDAVHEQGKQLLELIHSQGKELRERMDAQSDSLRAEMNALRADMNTFMLGMERFKWRFWAALVVLFVLQLLVAGGAPAAILRALKLP